MYAAVNEIAAMRLDGDGRATTAPFLDLAATDPIKIQAVERGDSLWTIATSQLDVGASDAAIRQRVLELMQANASVDPLKMRVGYLLVVLPRGIEIAPQTLERYNASDATYQVDGAGARLPPRGSRAPLVPAYWAGFSSSVISTRRFSWRPALVSLVASGLSKPAPDVEIRSAPTPPAIRIALTAFARSSDRRWL